MKIEMKNGSSIETIDLDTENIRSRRGEKQLQYYREYMEEFLNLLNLR